MARTTPFKLRLLDKELADLDARAEREGLAKADVIRRAMGWEIVGLNRPHESRGPSAPGSPPRAPSSASDEPGVAAASELARRIAERRGKQ